MRYLLVFSLTLKSTCIAIQHNPGCLAFGGHIADANPMTFSGRVDLDFGSVILARDSGSASSTKGDSQFRSKDSVTQSAQAQPKTDQPPTIKAIGTRESPQGGTTFPNSGPQQILSKQATLIPLPSSRDTRWRGTRTRLISAESSAVSAAARNDATSPARSRSSESLTSGKLTTKDRKAEATTSRTRSHKTWRKLKTSKEKAEYNAYAKEKQREWRSRMNDKKKADIRAADRVRKQKVIAPQRKAKNKVQKQNDEHDFEKTSHSRAQNPGRLDTSQKENLQASPEQITGQDHGPAASPFPLSRSTPGIQSSPQSKSGHKTSLVKGYWKDHSSESPLLSDMEELLNGSPLI